MAWVAVGATVISGAISLYGQNKAAKAQQKGADAATAEQARQFDQSRADQQPWLQAGQQALTQQQALNSGDFSSFYQSPDYAFARDQGLQSLERGAAARGGFMGGGADADRMNFASGLASQNYGNFYNRLAGMSNTGQGTATNLGNLGANYANNMGNLAINQGGARASSYQQKANMYGDWLGTAGNIAGNYFGGRG
jgi:hypothetical protein